VAYYLSRRESSGMNNKSSLTTEQSIVSSILLSADVSDICRVTAETEEQRHPREKIIKQAATHLRT
jgi:hypothetical protein